MLTNDWQPIEGGIATLCEGLAHALHRRGHELLVLAPALAGTRSSEDYGGVRVVRWPGYSWGWLRAVPFAAHAVRFLRSADVVLAMNPGYGGVLAATARVCGGPPFLAWAYGFELLKARSTPLLPLYRAVFRRALAAIAISRWTRSRLVDLGVPDHHIVVIRPGVAQPLNDGSPAPRSRHALGLPEGEIVLSVGRLVPRKGHKTLLAAFARVLTRWPTAQWVVVGRGPEQQAIATGAAALGIRDRVHLLGYVEAVRLTELYRAAAVFALLPTESEDDAEGFGIVFLEAGSHGLPVVATHSGGIGDAVSHGQSGILIAPGDETAAASAIVSLLHDPALRTRMGLAGRERSMAHSWDAAAGAVEALLP